MRVDHRRPLRLGANAVHPVIFISEAAAWPAQVGNLDGAQSLHHIVANAACVGNGGVLAHPHVAVDAPAQVLGEMPVDVPVSGTMLKDQKGPG